jgi:acetyl-CoA carboxylase carboxyltransferase component
MALTINLNSKLDELNTIKQQSLEGGGSKRIEAQHNKGKLTARERIALLADSETFEEIGGLAHHRCTDFAIDKQKFPGDSVITGHALINNRPVYIYSQDFTVFGGTVSEIASQKICKIMDLAAESGVPVIGLLDSGGARIQEGVDSLIGCGEIFTRNTLYSGLIPQISVIMGPCAGAAVYSPALTDFIFMVNNTAHMYITGPAVIKSVTSEDVSAEETGNAHIHSSKSGNCHFVFDSEEECLEKVRCLLSFLPSNNTENIKITETADKNKDILDDAILGLVPLEPNKAYDIRKIIMKIVDNDNFMEVHERFGRSIICGFAKLGTKTIGLVAQQPLYYAGSITVDASDKAARFIRFCDCFNIPVITLVDVPGYMPGVEQEHLGIIRHGAKLLFAYAEATTIKISVIIRKAYGGAYIAMGSKGLHSDMNFAWPTAEIAVMGPEGAVSILNRNILSSDNHAEEKQRLIDEYREKFANPYAAASKGYIDEVIDPRETRFKLLKALKILENKQVSSPRKKHGNMPL